MIALDRGTVEDGANRASKRLQSDFAKGDAKLRAEVAEARDFGLDQAQLVLAVEELEAQQLLAATGHYTVRVSKPEANR